MTGLVKGILITTVVLVIVGAIILGLGIYWISSHGSEYIQKGKQQIAEGQTFGQGTDNQGCVTEAVSRHKRDASMSAAIATQLFLASCLPSSRDTPEFCTDVPKPTEFIKSAQWQSQRCLKEDLRDSYCPQLFAQVQNFCLRKDSGGN